MTYNKEVVTLKDVKVDKTLSYIKEPEAIVDRKVRKLRNKEIALVKVRWGQSNLGTREGDEIEVPSFICICQISRTKFC